MTSNRYPFISKKDVIQRLLTDNLFLIEAVGIIHDRHHLPRSHSPSTGEAAGWSSSDRLRGERLYAAMALGQINDEVTAQAIVLLKRYVRQITLVLRQQQIDNDPSLRQAGLLFGVVRASPKATSPSFNDQANEAVSRTSGALESSEATAPLATPKRRGGRPRGSKNKARTVKKQ